MDVSILSSSEDLERFEDEWFDLWSRCPGASPFQSPDWLIPWWKNFGAGKVWAHLVRDDSGPAGIAPLYISEKNGRSEAFFIGTGVSDCLDFLIRPDSSLQAAACLCESIARGLGPLDGCDLQEVSADSPLLRADLTAACRMKIEPHNLRFVVALPESMELYLRVLANKHRNNLRRAKRLLRESGPAEIETPDADTLDSFLDALFSLHGRRWAEIRQPGVLQGEVMRSFHGEVCSRMLKRGLLRLYRMSLGNRPAAALYSFQRGGRVYCYLSGFDPEMGRCSPGMVLLEHAIEEAIGEGVREFDFLRGDEEYKMKWNPEPRRNYRVFLKPGKTGT